MKRKGWLAFAAAMAVVIGIVGCITEDEASKKHGAAALTWEGVARAIDNQMKQISDGTAAVGICGGNGAAIGLGGHCRNRLTGSVSTGSVLQLVRINHDLAGFFGDLTSPGFHIPVIHQGFQAMTNSPCTEDLLPGPGNGTPDVFETCANGISHITSCTDHGNYSYTVVYNDCNWFDGANTWVLNGQATFSSFSTTQDELINVAILNNFSMTDSVTTASLLMTGNAAHYQVVNPVFGFPAPGTTGLPDGMNIVNLGVTVDTDGTAGPIAPSSYVVDFADDFEDGLILLNGTAGVWPKDPTAVTGINFFSAFLPYNLTGPGCLVDITGFDATARTFNIVSHSLYGVNGCLPDSTTAIPY